MFLSCLYGSERHANNSDKKVNFLSCLYGSEQINDDGWPD
ncbi:Putative uncharacterized protein [Moritella viscosa]|uniref:Uncharacterized protein n=1 Tax=Moritella viscosa TaxID=80854 RepID=A0A1L0DT39_9GAMM|nr:Putative uncharacterized protein [Moritella viscosa]